MPFDRRHVFNAAYSIEAGSPVKGNPVLAGLVNGWQISGITQIQSGQNLAALQNFFANDVTLNSVQPAHSEPPRCGNDRISV